MAPVVVVASALNQSSILPQLQAVHHWPVVADPAQSPADAFVLADVAGQLGLFPPKAASQLGKHPLVVDFTSARFCQPVSRKSALGRACGFKPGRCLSVYDLTAGLGRDSWQLAAMGAQVCAFERHPVVYALLADGLSRAQSKGGFAHTVAKRIGLYHQDARTLSAVKADALLFDPMFPPREKRALVKKPMRMFAQLVGSDPDDAEVFVWALGQSVDRVVVKRPPGAAALLSAQKKAPDVVYASNRVRFDAYFPHSTEPAR